MSKFLLIESSEPLRASAEEFFGIAAELAALGNEVTLFLVQNAVLAARRGVRCEPLLAAATAGVEVAADAFSLRERGIGADRLADHVAPQELDVIVDKLARGWKALWH